MAGIPLRSADRDEQFPLILGGGVACFINPEPVAAFTDAFLMGEAEELLAPFFSRYDPEADRDILLEQMAREVPGLYVPGFYETLYNDDGTIQVFRPVRDVPERVKRMYLKDLSQTPACSVILTPDTSFDNTWLVEVSRGCPHGCRFCSAGYIYRPPRFRPPELLKTCMEQGADLTGKIGLMGAAVSDLPCIEEICTDFGHRDVRLSFSSLRADALTPELVSTLQRSQVKTATIAPEAGSERMRRVINKGITEAHILDAAENLVAGGIPNLKLYLMIGLPTETADDVDAIVTLCGKVKAHFLESSRAKGRIGMITVSLNSFVPKPVTPFQWAAMDSVKSLKEKIKQISTGLKPIPNVRLNHDAPRLAFVQALLSRGDRRVSDLLVAVHKNGGKWPEALKKISVNPDFYVCREREKQEVFPWDFIDHGIDRDFLYNEYERALAGKSSPPCPASDACHMCGVCGA